MSKMSKICVMLCMSKTSKMGKEHTHTFWLITSLILNGFSIQKKFWKALRLRAFQPYHQILVVKACEDVEDRSTHKGCNAMYVEDVGGKRTYTHILAQTSLYLMDFPLRLFQPYHQILCMSKHVEDVEDSKYTLGL